jgi:type II secretory pathway pseudopilin PulG
MRRGHVLALMLAILAAISASIVTFSSRLSVDLAARQDAGVRSQTLWLARSALLTGQSGSQLVPTRLGDATVVVQAGTATVTLDGATATVTADPWKERFTPARD